MEIKKLESHHAEIIKPLFFNENYMGENIKFFSNRLTEQGNNLTQYYNNFLESYLGDFKNYCAFGAFDNNQILGIISAYQNTDEPSWYGTQIRSVGSRQVVRDLLDSMIDYQEKAHRFKFYTLWNIRDTRLLRRFAFSDRNKERYDYFDEYFVPAKHRCFYTTHWQILYTRALLPVDTAVRCTFLKRKYRPAMPLGGGL
jgi:hypothetical protein